MGAKYLIISISFSLIINMAGLMLMDRILAPQDIDLSKVGKHQIRTSVIHRSARVDVVKMPEHTLQELKQLKHQYQKQKSLLNQVLNNLAQQEIPIPKNTEEKLSPRVLVLGGNKISEGSSIVGANAQTESHELHQYLDILADHVRLQWRLPNYLAEKELRCRIQIILSPQGELIRFELLESSGDADFDHAAMRATQTSSPFPVADPSLQKYLLEGFVVLGFPE